MPREPAISELVAADLPVAPINSVPEMVEEKLFSARGDFVSYPDLAGGSTMLPRPAARFGRLEPRAEFTGPDAGHHNIEVYQQWLGIPADQITVLAEQGAI